MFGTKIAWLFSTTFFFPFVIGILYYKKLHVSYKMLVLSIVLSVVAETLLITVTIVRGNNLFIIHFYTVAEIITLSLFFMHRFKRLGQKRTIQILMLTISAFALVYAGIGNNIMGFNGIPKGVVAVYFSLLSCLLFYEMSVEVGSEEDTGFYFINGAILWYFTSNFLAFAFSDLFLNDMNNLLLLHNIKTIVIAMCNISYAIGLWILSRSSYSAHDFNH
jgi:hypothetical protein